MSGDPNGAGQSHTKGVSLECIFDAWRYNGCINHLGESGGGNMEGEGEGIHAWSEDMKVM